MKKQICGQEFEDAEELRAHTLPMHLATGSRGHSQNLVSRLPGALLGTRV